MLEHVLLTEKYRPKTIDECVLPASLKKRFNEIVKNKSLPNYIFSGPPGVGKTTVAKAICEQLGCEYIVVNGSMNGNIDTLRGDIMQFATSVSMFGTGRKVVILDEADYLNMNSTQPALRNFMEEYAANCGFIMTCNYPNRIIEPLHSRCALVDFTIPAEEKVDILKASIVMVRDILKNENIEHDIRVVAEVVKRYFPDMRRTINILQEYSNTGKIDAGILSRQSNVADVIKILKNKKFQDMRTWVAENSGLDFHLFATDLYAEVPKEIEPQKIPHLVLILNKYDYQNSFVGNKEVNIVAMLLEVMSDCF